MIDFVRLQLSMKERLEQDRGIHSVDAEGATLESAVAEAAALLNIPVRRLEYEITERGFPGFLGSGKKNWKIRAYEQAAKKQETKETILFDDEVEEIAVVRKDRDGKAFVHLYHDGVYLKVSLPVGKGKRAAEVQALRALADKNIDDFDHDIVKTVLREASGKYVRVGNFHHNPSNDAFLSVDITEQDMKANITMNPPGPGGCDLSWETIVEFLRNNRVVYGIREDFLRDFADQPRYKESVLAAEGLKPVDGRDACMQFNFEGDLTQIHLREGSNGKVDFKELNIIQNVWEGQPLAKKLPAEFGVAGKTVTGRVLPSRNGKDIPLPLGKNVHVGDDGITIIADMNGQVVIISGKINVEPVYTVQGNVNLKTGNIIFLGTVIINGNVEDGFSVKAAGNIEVDGTVEKAEMDAEGDIIVHQGITGKNTGTIKAGRSIWARFIENANIEAGNMVVVSDGIINSQVDASRRIICQGKRAHIVGGRLRATEEISAKIIGSPTSGTETICEVGFDPKRKEQLDNFIAGKENAEKELEEVQLNIQTLINIKKQRKSLPEDKEAYMQELMDRRKDLETELGHVTEEITKIQEFFNSLENRGRVSVSGKVYPGVKIIIRDAREDVRNEFRASTFILENGLVRVTKYEESDEDLTKGIDGYSTD
ncbi:MAG: FapA family protein [Spirochaetaceae bacterium]|jgi:uncharacterized protein (DUF342 family)|nr:FapA family protein [Spirochaetaceae bacterium]